MHEHRVDARPGGEGLERADLEEFVLEPPLEVARVLEKVGRQGHRDSVEVESPEDGLALHLEPRDPWHEFVLGQVGWVELVLLDRERTEVLGDVVRLQVAAVAGRERLARRVGRAPDVLGAVGNDEDGVDIALAGPLGAAAQRPDGVAGDQAGGVNLGAVGDVPGQDVPGSSFIDGGCSSHTMQGNARL